MNFTNINRTFRRYKLYYELLRDFKRFRHCTISFRILRDIAVAVRNWFHSDECIALPVTDTCSASFWRNEPTQFHTFDTITVINDHQDADTESHLDEDDEEVESDREEDIVDEEWLEERPQRQLPLTRHQFQQSTEWLMFDPSLHQGQDCSICHSPYRPGERITNLYCNHYYHTHCIQTWLTERSNNCPFCRYLVG